MIKKYGMTCVSNEEGKNSRIVLNLAGKYLGAFKTLVSISIGFDTKLGCLVKAQAVSEKEDLDQELIDALA